MAALPPAAIAKPAQPPPAFGWILSGIGLAIFALSLIFAVLKFIAARDLQRRKSRPCCMIVPGISCLEFTHGTLLGVFTFMVLGRAPVAHIENS